MRRFSYVNRLWQWLISALKKIVSKAMPRFYKKLSQLRFKYNAKKNVSTNKRDRRFVSYQENSPIQPVIKAIAFYSLKPYRITKKNRLDKNVFISCLDVIKNRFHLKSPLPKHFERYDLHDPELIRKQMQLAKNYGVYGFSYLLHWSNGAFIMGNALQEMLKNNAIDMPFCLTWANGNLTEQDYSQLDAIALFQYVLEIFRDKRYICIEDKPVFIIHKANNIPNIQNIVKRWHVEAQAIGIPGIYLIAMQEKNLSSAVEIGFDALIESPLKDFDGEQLFDYKEVVQALIRNPMPSSKFFKAVSVSSNPVTAEESRDCSAFCNFDLNVYERWLSYSANKLYHNPEYTADEKIIFINAWNSWEEGAYLEPDEQHNYGCLQKTYDVLKDYDEKKLYALALNKPQKKNHYAVVLHLFFDELWPEICRYLNNFKKIDFDLHVSITSVDVGFKVREKFPHAYIYLTENRGRDILPFIEIFPLIESMKYTAVCKIHSKFTMQAAKVGKAVREELFRGLLGSDKKINKIVSMFNEDKNLGMLVPRRRLLTISQYMFPNEFHFNKLCQLLKLDDDKDPAEYVFPAGSMFWFNPQALTRIKEIKDYFFELESGATDGKIEHAVERVFCLIAKKQGYRVSSC